MSGTGFKSVAPAMAVLKMLEVDLLRGGLLHDLSSFKVQQKWIRRLDTHEFDIVLITPPCSSYSRAQYANKFGPCPVRSSAFPLGFPWLSNADRKRADLGNSLVDFTWQVLQRVQDLRGRMNITAFAEHPEDLGRTSNMKAVETPASIWRMAQFDKLLSEGWWSGGFRQCDHGAPTPKPTRATSCSHNFTKLASHCKPWFDKQGFYEGPVQYCNHNHSQSLIRKATDSGAFKTAASAANPPDMCKIIADCLYDDWMHWTPAAVPSAGEKTQLLQERR